MKKPTLNGNQLSIRRHFLAEWLGAKGLKPADFLRLLNADPTLPEINKTQVYRWIEGQTPQPAMQKRIAATLKIEPGALMRNPDAEWLADFFEGRTDEERARIKQVLELSWPKPPIKRGPTN